MMVHVCKKRRLDEGVDESGVVEGGVMQWHHLRFVLIRNISHRSHLYRQKDRLGDENRARGPLAVI